MPIVDVTSPGGTSLPVNGSYDPVARELDTDAVTPTHRLIAANELQRLADAGNDKVGGVVGEYAPVPDIVEVSETSALFIGWTFGDAWSIVNGVRFCSTEDGLAANEYNAVKLDNSLNGDRLIIRWRNRSSAGTLQVFADQSLVHTSDLSVVGQASWHVIDVTVQTGRDIEIVVTPDAAALPGEGIDLHSLELFDTSVRVLPDHTLITAAYQELLVTQHGNWLNNILVPGQRLIAMVDSPAPDNEAHWSITPKIDIDSVLKTGNTVTEQLVLTSGAAGNENLVIASPSGYWAFVGVANDYSVQTRSGGAPRIK